MEPRSCLWAALCVRALQIDPSLLSPQTCSIIGLSTDCDRADEHLLREYLAALAPIQNVCTASVGGSP
jgi:hypothetical protein